MKEINKTLAERDELKAENEKLKAENEKRLNAIEDFTVKHCYLKCDIAKILVKDFAEKLKELLHNDYIMLSGITDERCVFEGIDELLKEYEE